MKEKFEAILNTIHIKGITTKAALMEDQMLYSEFCYEASNFILHCCLLSKNGKKTKDNRRLCGNRAKIDFLESRGITSREDVVMDCVVILLKHIDDILCKPTVAYMKNYVYAIVNSVVNDICKTIPTDKFKMVYLDSTIEGANNIDAEDACTYGDRIVDNTYNPELLYFEGENIKELEKVLEAKKVQEQAEKRAVILQEVTRLSERPEENMIRLACTHLHMKPRELTRLILDKGCEIAYTEIIVEVAKKSDLKLAVLRNIISGYMVAEEALKANTKNPKVISGQISRLAYRANKHLEE